MAIDPLYCSLLSTTVDLKLTEEVDVEEKPIVYFAYGATMNQDLLEAKVKKVKFIGKGVLMHFQLNFAKTKVDRTAKATIIPNRYHVVEGAIYHLTTDQLKKLDQSKKSPQFRNRVNMYVKRKITGPDILVELHAFDFEQGKNYSPPQAKYLQLMLKGAQKIGVTTLYYQYLQSHVLLAKHKSKL